MDHGENSKEQLIAQIEVLSSQIAKLEAGEEKRQKAQEERALPDRDYRLYFDSVPVGVCVTTVGGDILHANNTLLELVGYSREEYAARNIMDTYADLNQRRELLARLNETKNVREFEAVFKKKDGALFTVLINTDFIEAGGRRLLLTAVNDISRYKQIKEELREVEERYRLFFNNAPVGLTVTDLEGELYASNQAVRTLLGYSQAELVGRNVGDFYEDEQDRRRLLQLLEQSAAVRDFETRFRHKNGNPVSVLLNTDHVELSEKKQGLLTSIRDISSSKQAQEALTRERDFTNAILEVATSLILVMDQEGRITRFNRACELTSGFSLREVAGKHVWDLLAADPEKSRQQFLQAAQNSPSYTEDTWLTKSGEERLISWSSTLLADQEGHVRHIIATGIDITEERAAKLKLQKANQMLTAGIRELEESTAEMSRLSDMGDQLQSCQTLEEACAISAQYIQMICPGTNGALFLIRPSKDLAEAVELWGEAGYTDELFLPLDCWAIRRGRSHLVDGSHPGLMCKHLQGPQEGQYLCVPLMAHGEVLGILHLDTAEGGPKGAEVFSEHKVKTVMAVAEHIALALSNLKLRETLRQQSIRDTLTGIYNRRYMEDSLIRELHRAEREKKAVGIIMFDIDRFKDFNDFYGHDGGDALLRGLGDFLLKSTRGEDIVCRYGGEEFVAVMPGASLEDTRLRAEQLRLGVRELQVYHMGRPMSSCSISLGVAVFPEHGVSGEELLKKADKALYRAKSEGRDKVAVYGQE